MHLAGGNNPCGAKMILYLTKVKFTEKGDSNDAADNCIG